MSDSDLKQLLSEKNLLVPSQQAGVSYAMALLMEKECGFVDNNQLSLPDGSTVALKSLTELYADAKPAKDAEIDALSMVMEYAIAYYDHENDHSLRDGETIKMLEKLSMKPETALEGVGGLLQAHLRLELSLKDYSRADVRTAVRRIQRSAQRQSKGDERGYLNHIHHLMH